MSKGAWSSYGAVVGDSKGMVRVNCARKLEGIFDDLLAEALTIVATPKTARDLHFHPIILRIIWKSIENLIKHFQALKI